MILHITSKQEWLDAQQRGVYAAPSLETEGYIHCSTEKQAVHVAEAFYRGRTNLVVLCIDEEKLESEIKWEAPKTPPAVEELRSDLFPHVYGPINLTAVLSAVDLY
jgi:uncharacterized protein (DUF952 family)